MVEVSIKDLETSRIIKLSYVEGSFDNIAAVLNDCSAKIEGTNKNIFSDYAIKITPVKKCFNSEEYSELEYLSIIDNHLDDYMYLPEEYYDAIIHACSFSDEYYEYFWNSIDKYNDAMLSKYMLYRVLNPSLKLIESKLEFLKQFEGKLGNTDHKDIESELKFQTFDDKVREYVDNYIHSDSNSSIKLHQALEGFNLRYDSSVYTSNSKFYNTFCEYVRTKFGNDINSYIYKNGIIDEISGLAFNE